MNYLKNIIEKLQRGNLFLTGGAGVGKTTITKSIISHYETEAKKVAKLASTGMAATLINGQTLHSFFDLGVCNDLQELTFRGKFEISNKVKKLLKVMDLIVIDEISMVSSKLFDMIDLRLKQSDFKGSILVVGDFLQLPPIVSGYGEVNFAFESLSWREFNFEIVELTHIYRTDDKSFIDLLSEIRVGFVDERVHNLLNEFVKPFGENLSEFTFLFGKNNSASIHNKNQLLHIDGELYVKEAQIVKHIKSVKDVEIERFMQDARVEKDLELKVGARVLFSRNSWNYFNGERGVIVNIDNSFVYVQKSDNIVVKLEAVSQSKSLWSEKIVDGKKEMVEEPLFSIYQYPIKLSYAITIHKSQGMSIEDLIIESNEIFAPSQFYVAISRCSNPKRLTLIAPRRGWREIVFVDKKAVEFVKKSSMIR